MPKYLNNYGISLSMAVWLAEDTYDHNNASNHISTTALLRPIKQIVLGSRIPKGDSTEDIISLVPSKMGTAIHDSIEGAWKRNYATSLKDLGYPPGVIKNILINPEPEELYDGCIPIYMEKRTVKQVGKWLISGKFDFVGDGRLEDFKSTGTYTYTHKTSDKSYIAQGSIYRWLNPTIVTSDWMAIQFLFTDFQAHMVKTVGYPAARVLEYVLPLDPIDQTEKFVLNKLNLIEFLHDKPEEDIPECTTEELWRSEAKFKYYGSGNVTARSTKNFDTQVEANTYMASKGKGIVIEAKGEVKRCKYCSAAPICKQKDVYLADGSLKL